MNTQLQSLQLLAFPVCAVDPSGHVIFWNQYMTELLGLPTEGALGQEWHEVVHDDCVSNGCAFCQTRAALRNGEPASPVDAVVGRGWRKRRLTMIPLPLGPDSGAGIGFILLERPSAPAQLSPRKPVSIDQRIRRSGAKGEGVVAPNLTPRERQILDCVTNGMDARAIAIELGITHATARNYVQRILCKLGVRNKAEAVNVALTYNLLAS